MIVHTGALSAPLRSRYGGAAGFVKTWLSNVQCSGQESRLEECAHDGWGVARVCYHSINDASVECEGMYCACITL